MNGILEIINNSIKKENLILKKFEEVYHNRSSEVFCYFNQNSFNQIYSKPELLKAFKEFIIYQEGIGMYLLLKLFNQREFDRIDSTKILDCFIKYLITKGERIIFIGGDFEPAKFISDCNYKDLIVEIYLNGFFDLNNLDNLMHKLKTCKSRYIILGMGTPKQEIVAHKLKRELKEKTFICVGNFMNFFLGYQKRAPKFLRKLQLEWLFRFILEPKRLFKRYVLGIPLFFFRITKLKLQTIK
ncbi:MAG: WecB/TagA/CpsF family glycosyltransferase [Ignavibacterium sp.]|nr:WecB/TagA/CpsF family glycosyltransferase [Ignavibacterium sp.]MDW8375970.1 WecB/TagA/CpsF family glycosyltransferase [Ignavibacteriales bacterium]